MNHVTKFCFNGRYWGCVLFNRLHLQLIRLSARLENVLTDDEQAKDKFDHIINLRTREEEKKTPDTFTSRVACHPFVSYLSRAMFSYVMP